MCGRSRGERGRLAWKRFVRLQSRRQPINPSGPSPLGDTHHQHRDHDDEHRSVVVAGVRPGDGHHAAGHRARPGRQGGVFELTGGSGHVRGATGGGLQGRGCSRTSWRGRGEARNARVRHPPTGQTTHRLRCSALATREVRFVTAERNPRAYSHRTGADPRRLHESPSNRR
jgi:hypothetical protein